MFDVRLVKDGNLSTSSGVGRVELKIQGSDYSWGTICDDMWDARDAVVICRMITPGQVNFRLFNEYMLIHLSRMDFSTFINWASPFPF